jgi:hypothetical protein
MRLDLDDLHVLIDLRATGLLRAVGHDPTLTARPEARVAVDVGAGSQLGFPVAVAFRADAIELPSDISASDRQKMRENLLGAEVLDAARHPAISFTGRYEGSLEGGSLSGDLVVRGAPRRLELQLRSTRSGDRLSARGAWEGRLTSLGIKPFKALLGALKLQDWIRLRVEAQVAVHEA